MWLRLPGAQVRTRPWWALWTALATGPAPVMPGNYIDLLTGAPEEIRALIHRRPSRSGSTTAGCCRRFLAGGCRLTLQGASKLTLDDRRSFSTWACTCKRGCTPLLGKDRLSNCSLVNTIASNAPRLVRSSGFHISYLYSCCLGLSSLSLRGTLWVLVFGCCG